jgi:chromosomal replication initiation ATPase DnaA
LPGPKTQALNERGRQLRLPFPLPDDRALASLLTDDGVAKALAPLWAGAPAWPRGVLVMLGEPGSGKTHCLRAFLQAHRKSGPVLTLSALGALSGAPDGWRVAAIDDADRIRDEAGLFTLLEQAADGQGRRLLLTAQAGARGWGLTMPDLISRLEAAPRLPLPDPSEALLTKLLTRLCRHRFMKLEHSGATYLARSMNRTYPEAHRVVEALDALYGRSDRPVTAPMAARALMLVNPGAGESLPLL